MPLESNRQMDRQPSSCGHTYRSLVTLTPGIAAHLSCTVWSCPHIRNMAWLSVTGFLDAPQDRLIYSCNFSMFICTSIVHSVVHQLRQSPGIRLLITVSSRCVPVTWQLSIKQGCVDLCCCEWRDEGIADHAGTSMPPCRNVDPLIVAKRLFPKADGMSVRDGMIRVDVPDFGSSTTDPRSVNVRPSVS
jgi:hypothetical protein